MFNKNSRKKFNKITLEGLIQGFLCYVASIGALAMTIIGKGDYVVRFHAMQSLIFHIFISLAEFLLRYSNLNIFTVYSVFKMLRIIVLICGTYHVATRQIVRYPIIGKYVR